MAGAHDRRCCTAVLKFFDRIEWPELDVDRERNVRFIPPLASKQRQVA
jgi:hypothetical protein